jgi:tRNA (guanine26-N2/guanine27-N2)-dimethyltransferase
MAENMHRRVPDIIDKIVEETELMEYPYVDLHALCDLYNLTPPKNVEVMEALQEQGHRTSRTHFRNTAIRTDAPIEEVRSVIETITGR